MEGPLAAIKQSLPAATSSASSRRARILCAAASRPAHQLTTDVVNTIADNLAPPMSLPYGFGAHAAGSWRISLRSPTIRSVVR